MTDPTPTPPPAPGRERAPVTLCVCTLCAGDVRHPIDIRPIAAPFVDTCDRCGSRAMLHYRVTPYPVLVRFTRTFTRGLLAGLSHPDVYGAVDEDSARRWVAGIAREQPEYRLDNVTIERVTP